MVFVVGNSRSGTKTMAEVLSCADDVSVYHEANVYPWLELEKEGYGRNSARKEILRQVVKFLPPKWAIKAQEETKIPIDSNHFISPVIPCIHYLMPKSRFIYLLRNPADIIRSWMNLVFPLNDEFLEKDLIYEVHRWRPFQTQITDRFMRLCFYWRYTNMKIQSHLKDVEHTVIKIEELTEDLGRIWEWIGLRDGLDKALKKAEVRFNGREPARKPPFPSYSKWTDEQKLVYEKIVVNSTSYSY